MQHGHGLSPTHAWSVYPSLRSSITHPHARSVSSCVAVGHPLMLDRSHPRMEWSHPLMLDPVSPACLIGLIPCFPDRCCPFAQSALPSTVGLTLKTTNRSGPRSRSVSPSCPIGPPRSDRSPRIGLTSLLDHYHLMFYPASPSRSDPVTLIANRSQPRRVVHHRPLDRCLMLVRSHPHTRRSRLNSGHSYPHAQWFHSPAVRLTSCSMVPRL
jgi:hypothetical protein